MDRNGALASQYMASLLIRGYDFVVVQSAGNGAADHLGVDARYNGLFAAIDADNCSTANGKVTVTAQDIMDRVIIVGAAGEQDENGVYMQTSFSNGGGDQVDIAAPRCKHIQHRCRRVRYHAGHLHGRADGGRHRRHGMGRQPCLKRAGYQGYPMRVYHGQCCEIIPIPQRPWAAIHCSTSWLAAARAAPLRFRCFCYDPILEEYRKGAQNNYYNGDFSMPLM